VEEPKAKIKGKKVEGKEVKGNEIKEEVDSCIGGLDSSGNLCL